MAGVRHPADRHRPGGPVATLAVLAAATVLAVLAVGAGRLALALLAP
jgi:hypothetical protein